MFLDISCLYLKVDSRMTRNCTFKFVISSVQFNTLSLALSHIRFSVGQIPNLIAIPLGFHRRHANRGRFCLHSSTEQLHPLRKSLWYGWKFQKKLVSGPWAVNSYLHNNRSTSMATEVTEQLKALERACKRTLSWDRWVRCYSFLFECRKNDENKQTQ